MIALAWLTLWTPFFAAAAIFFLLLNQPRLAGRLATGALFVSFALSLTLFLKLGSAPAPLESSFHWVLLPGVDIEFGILVNGLTLLMLLIVTGVGALIFLYSQEYMHHDPGYARYFACLAFFAFSMLGIVLANNLIQIFIFWELVGLSSYLLIGHWFEKPAASEAAKKAFLTTRVGDVGFLLGILLLFGWLSSGGFPTFNCLILENLFVGFRDAGTGAVPHVLTVTGFLIFLGVMGKSAQFPLHVWLPDAMEGPAPVSALIHASTLVAAGVFLLARLFFLFSVSPFVLGFIASIGTLTALMAATVALVENDIKRILAYSTLSQLGYMVAVLGLSDPQAGMFHLSTHAFFKALLFLGAGSVTHACHTQEIWKMSGLLKRMPVTGWTFLAGALALAGIFPSSGFWSKEELLMSAFHTSPSIFALLLLTALFTAVYIGRLFTIVFLRPAQDAKKIQDPRWTMMGPLLVLAVFSLGAGLLPLKNFVPPAYGLHHGSFLVTLLGLTVAMGGFLGTVYVYLFRPRWFDPFLVSLRVPRKILERKYFMDEMYGVLIRYGQDAFAHLCDLFERYVIVQFAVNGTARLTRWSGDLLRRLQTGKIQFYALLFSAGVTLLTYGLLLWNR